MLHASAPLYPQNAGSTVVSLLVQLRVGLISPTGTAWGTSDIYSAATTVRLRSITVPP